uniref:Uncharacterized protein n=1 Tax=Romanomermis culicivorax TaxID=13658 RepID=A0A915KZ76_ROMCU
MTFSVINVLVETPRNLSNPTRKTVCYLLKLEDEMDKLSSLSHFVVEKRMDNADQRSEELDVAIAEKNAVGDQPFGVVENPGFINLIKKALYFGGFFIVSSMERAIGQPKINFVFYLHRIILLIELKIIELSASQSNALSSVHGIENFPSQCPEGTKGRGDNKLPNVKKLIEIQ